MQLIMKINIFIIIFLIFIFKVIKGEKHSNTKIFSKATEKVINEYYVKNSLKFDFVIFGNESSTFGLEVISYVLKSNNIETTEIIMKTSNDRSIQLKKSAIIFMSSEEKLEEFNRKLSMEIYDVDFQHFVIFEEIKNETSIKPKTYFESILFYQVFMYKLSGKVIIEYFEKFATFDCGSQKKILNEYILKTDKWINKNFGLQKAKNFNGCQMKVGHPDDSLSDTYYGSFVLILKELENKLNFTFSLVNYPTGTDHFDFEIKDVYNCTNLKSPRWFYFFLKSEEALLVSIGRSYTEYEKFILPFDGHTWLWNGIFFATAFLVILIINRTRNQQLQSFVYGDRVRVPMLNVIISFFGQSQNIMPSRSFARYLLMIFKMFCLINRTGYQGVQFEMMYKDIRVHSPDYIDDLGKDGYYINEMLDFEGSQNYLDKINNLFEKGFILNRNIESFNNPTGKIAMIYPRYPLTDYKEMTFIYWNWTHFPMKFTKDNIYETKWAFSTNINNICFKLFRDEVEKLFEAGIANVYEGLQMMKTVSLKNLFSDLEIYNDKIELTVLSLTHLKAGFIIWLVSIVIATLGFIGEHVHYRLWSCKKRKKGKTMKKVYSIKPVKVKNIQVEPV